MHLSDDRRRYNLYEVENWLEHNEASCFEPIAVTNSDEVKAAKIHLLTLHDTVTEHQKTLDGISTKPKNDYWDKNDDKRLAEAQKRLKALDKRLGERDHLVSRLISVLDAAREMPEQDHWREEMESRLNRLDSTSAEEDFPTVLKVLQTVRLRFVIFRRSFRTLSSADRLCSEWGAENKASSRVSVRSPRKNYSSRKIAKK